MHQQRIRDKTWTWLGSRAPLAIALIIALFSILFINSAVLKGYPMSGDEYNYILQAKIFLSGRLNLETPENVDLHWYSHIITSRGFYPKAPPGFSFILAIAGLTGRLILANLTISLLTILLVFLVTREIFSKEAASLAVLFMSICPYFTFFSATYYAHPLSLLLTSLIAYLTITAIKTGSAVRYLLLGSSFGFLILTRHYDAFLLFIAIMPVIAYHQAARNDRKKGMHRFDREWITRTIKTSTFIFCGMLPFLITWCAYNEMQTGNPLLMPFSLYNPADSIAIPTSQPQLLKAFDLATRNIQALSFMIPYGAIALLIASLSLRGVKWPGVIAMTALFLLFLIGYSFYIDLGNTLLKPRYLYPASLAIYSLFGHALSLIYSRSRPVFIAIASILLIMNHIAAVNNSMYFDYFTDKKASAAEAVAISGSHPGIYLYNNDAFGRNAFRADDYFRHALEFDNARMLRPNLLYDADNLESLSASVSARYRGMQIYLVNCSDSVLPDVSRPLRELMWFNNACEVKKASE